MKAIYKDLILCIEDNSETSQMLLDAFEKSRCNMVLAKDGKQGLALFEIYKKRINAIILDILVPEIDGLEILKKIGHEALDLHIPIIVLTNLNNPVDRQQAFSYGAADYIVKGEYSLQEIILKIKTKIIDYAFPNALYKKYL